MSRPSSSELPSADPVSAERVVEGIGVAPGVAIGPVYLYAGGGYQAEAEHLAPDEVKAEVDRFERAVARSERELRKVTTVARQKVGNESAMIFEAQSLILRDPAFFDAVRDLVRSRKMGAGWAVQTIVERHRQRMEGGPTAALRDRAGDILDVQDRVLRNLQQGRAVSRIDENRVVVAQSLTAADLLLFSRRGVLGVVMDFGGPTSHVAILARALEVPAIVSLHGLADHVGSGDMIVCDGFSGRVVVNPADETLRRYREKRSRYESFAADRDEIVAMPSETLDGHPVALQANVEFPEEMPLLQEYGAEGIGLFRTEMLFLTEGRTLDEEQQYEVYRDAVRAASPHPVTLRLLDLGGDKVLPLTRREPNPFLGWRGLRVLLDKPELLRPQLRAALRAAAEGEVRLLLPMITMLDELDGFREYLSAVSDELEAEGAGYEADVPLGVMVEVPAVALQAERFAQKADFFSVGTNDLTQFTLAVDRGNDLVVNYYQELHPSVLQLIARTFNAARQAGIPVSVCGEVAGDPRVVPLLVGLGVDALSVSPAYVTLVKRVLRALTLDEARQVAQEALCQSDAVGVRELLNRWLIDHNPDLADLLGLPIASSPSSS